MRKILVLLLVVGLLVGMIAAVEGICEEFSTGRHADFSGDEEPANEIEDPAPCGGGGEGGGGPAVPG